VLTITTENHNKEVTILRKALLPLVDTTPSNRNKYTMAVNTKLLPHKAIPKEDLVTAHNLHHNRFTCNKHRLGVKTLHVWLVWQAYVFAAVPKSCANAYSKFRDV